MFRLRAAVLVGLLVPLVLDIDLRSQPAATERAIAVSQGTSMAAAVSPDGTRIVIDLQGSLWTLPRAGGRATRITDDLHDARQPSWSPDGKTIAFQSYRDGTWDLWTTGADGSGARAVTTGPFDDREPHWSPDGGHLAFSSDRSGNYDIWVLELATGTVRQLTRDGGNDYWPAWSPDGREIAFVAERATAPGIRAITLDGTERLLVPSAARLGAPGWTGDGRDVVFSALAGSITRLMLGERELSASEDVFPFRPHWTASSLVYTADGQIKERPVADPGAPPRAIPFEAVLTVRSASYTPRPRSFDDAKPRRALGIVRPGLSPDGQRLVFAALGDIWIGGPGAVPTRVTDDVADDTDPAWSPDGTRIAYASDRDGSFDVFVRDMASGAEKRVTSTPSAELRPTWSPDGTRIAFVTVGGLTGGQVSVADLRTGTIRLVLDGRIGPLSPGWSRDGRTIFVSVLRPYSTRYREGVNQVLAVPSDGGDPRPITFVPDVSAGKGGEGPAWSRDGRHVAFAIDGELHVMPLSAAGEPSGPARSIAPGVTADQVSWTWDSRRVLFSANDRVKIADLDGDVIGDWPVDLTYVRRNPAGTVVIHAGRLVDGVSADVRRDVDVVIAGHRIARIVPHSDREHTGRVVDASGLTAMPGLIEAHGHFSPEFGRAFGRVHLAYGITSVRSPGGPPYPSVAQREAVEAGRRPGPRLFATGHVIDGNRVYYPIAAPSPTAAAIDREIERARLLEFDLLKTYVRLPDALQRRAIDAAHRIGIPVSSHEVYPAAASGVDSVEHLGATSRRGYSPKVSLLGRSYDDVRRIVSASGMTITPTLALGAARRVIEASAPIRSDPRWLLLPAWVRASFDRPGPAAPAAATQTRGNLLAFHKAGARIIAGTDSPLVPYGIALHIELEEYVGAGLTPLEALQTATINVARALNVDRDLGTVEAGKLADLTLVEGNPLEDIRATRQVRIVVVNGEVFTVQQLLE